MSLETVYLKINQISECKAVDVYLKDIASVHCQNRSIEAKVKTIKVCTFHPNETKSTFVHIGNIIEILQKIQKEIPNCEVENLGETDFVIQYKTKKKSNIGIQWLKTGFISAISFCGAAFAIMTFNNDANVSDVFRNLYYLTMGEEPKGATVLEYAYSIGITIGILVFFNHFAKWKLTVDPTPIEVEMRLYEDNLNKTLIQNHGRKESGIDNS